MYKCKNCGKKNVESTNYCQYCGTKIEKSMNIKNIFESLKLGNIAGMGAKGISIAPLFNLESGKNVKRNFNITKVILLKDGSWYCPECGNHNKNLNIYCNNCGLYRK